MTSATPAETARAFVEAIAWGEHLHVWELLGSEGRRAVVRIATNRGLDPALGARLRDGTASTKEQDAFLTDLVNGLRNDLVGVDVDTLEYVNDPAPEVDRARVLLVTPVPEELEIGGLPVGTVELAREAGEWRVERLLPRKATSVQ